MSAATSASLAQVIARYWTAPRTDAVLVLGSEYDCSLAPIEFAWNTRISANLDVPMALVVPSDGGAGETRQRAEVAIDEANRNYAQVVAVIAPRAAGQRLDAADLAELPVRAFVVDEVTGATSGLAGAVDALDATVVAGADELSGVRTQDVLIADMGLVNLLPQVRPASTVLFSADRRRSLGWRVRGGDWFLCQPPGSRAGRGRWQMRSGSSGVGWPPASRCCGPAGRSSRST